MTKLAIIYHSGYGHTEKMAHHVKKGAASVDGVETLILKLEDGNEDFSAANDADAIIFGSPTYMGSVSAVMKNFMEKTSPLFAKRQWKDKLAGGFTLSHSLSGDKLNALMQINIFAMQHGMIWAGFDELNQSPDGEPGKEDVMNRMGAFLGLMGQTENAPADITPPSGDLLSAEYFGKRLAETAKRFKKA
ncbi:MAG: flavodoxin [Micavibrio sp.]|nr:flavodoxin [Micavibrio sp.]|tara:strand:- start:714 stop:1283 length:570 start_codon:yes stop_codon:yes gene_type:complete